MRFVIYGLGKSGTSALFYKVRTSLPPGTIALFEPASFGPRERLRTRLGALRHGHFAPDVLAKVLPCDVRPVRIADFDGFERQLLIVRDPRDRIVSDLLYRCFNAQFVRSVADCADYLALLRWKEADPASVTLIDILQRFEALEAAAGAAASWVERYSVNGVACPLRFHDARPQLRAFRYEQMVKGDFGAAEEILGLPLTGTATVPGGLQRVARTKAEGSWRHWFTRGDVERFRPIVQPFLDRYYPQADWDLSADPVLDPLYGSQYVERVMNERRAWSGLPPLPPGS